MHNPTTGYREMSLCSFIESCCIYPPVQNTPFWKNVSKTSLSSNKHTGLEISHLVRSKGASTKHTHD